MRIKIICILLSLFLLVELINVQTYAYESIGSLQETVYIDGNKILISLDQDGNITAISKDCPANRLTIDSQGHGSATIRENFFNYDEYELDIDELNGDNIDLDIINTEEETFEHIESADELIDDSYDPQVATTIIVGISVKTLITAVLVAAACVVASGIVWYAAKAAVKYIQKQKRETKFYRAYIYNKNIFIDINPVSRANAISRIKRGLSVYTFQRQNAKSIITAAGFGVIGPETSCLKGHIKFAHFHRSDRKAHSFYGLPC